MNHELQSMHYHSCIVLLPHMSLVRKLHWNHPRSRFVGDCGSATSLAWKLWCQPTGLPEVC